MVEKSPDDPAPITPAGRRVELFNEHIWRELRAYAQVPDDFVNEGWSFETLMNGGGKGGSLMARIGHLYIVKELSNGDHNQLLAITGSYAAHVRSGDTILSPIYLHFRDEESGRFFFAMRNTIGEGPFQDLYDLKGCADDKTLMKEGEWIKAVHKRIWNVGMWLSKSSWTDERVNYHKGKMAARHVSIMLGEGQREKVMACLNRDVGWLMARGLMDYSLLVGVKVASAGAMASLEKSGPSDLAQRWSFPRKGLDGSSVVVCISIIDFFQRWTNGKRAARIIKVVECNKATVPPAMYGQRFLRHFSDRLVEEPPPERAPTAPASIAPTAGDAASRPVGDEEVVEC